jgi:hypothetical protein
MYTNKMYTQKMYTNETYIHKTYTHAAYKVTKCIHYQKYHSFTFTFTGPRVNIYESELLKSVLD